MKKAILFGATGFIGSYLLDELLNSTDYDQVVVVVRNGIDRSHPKLLVVLADFHSLQKQKDKIVGDDVFIALGTTRKKVPDQKEYYQIDHDYPILAAKIAKDNGAQSVAIVTSVGANLNSAAFYIRTKGEIERDIIALDYKHTFLFRPSMLMGSRQEKRFMEKILIKTFSIFNPIFVFGMDIYKGIEGRDVAKAMISAVKKPSKKIKIFHWQEMQAAITAG